MRPVAFFDFISPKWGMYIATGQAYIHKVTRPGKATTLDEFHAWLRTELEEALPLSRSVDFGTRKRANDRVEALRQTLKTLEECIDTESVAG